jgi:HAD superfamily hydrolase (TIGR01509 family)
MRFAELEAVTVDGYGTLLTLADPIRRLIDTLAAHGVSCSAEEVAKAFAAEVRHYRPRAHRASNQKTLAALRHECTDVFLTALGNPLPTRQFVDPFIAALEFEPVAGAAAVLDALTERGLRLAVVANWDCTLSEHLDRAGLLGHFDAVVTSAEAGVPKPDPAIFRLALARLDAHATRALHIGDEPADREGAHAAGMRFAPAPLRTAFEDWT